MVNIKLMKTSIFGLLGLLLIWAMADIVLRPQLRMVREWADVRHWEATPATLISNKLVSIDAQWYRDGHINASYQYKYKGVSFVGTRVVIFIPPVARYDILKALSDQLNKVDNKSGELIV